TETGQIDFDKCISGCRLCVDACPSHAIYLVPDEYAVPQTKTDTTTEKLNILAESKSKQELIASAIAEAADNKTAARVAGAIARSNRIMAEDCYREAGYMLPQSTQTSDLLKQLLETEKSELFPAEAAERLLELL
ncbi:MAG: hypothetical protein GX028_07390, partial [Clostridiaceae bacterium]|nr:hypothetical protein [Clostridiaceae bacterium]